MADTHDYETKSVLGKDLDETMILVGESGGLSAVYENKPSSLPIIDEAVINASEHFNSRWSHSTVEVTQ
jgi:hypothetical protein